MMIRPCLIIDQEVQVRVRVAGPEGRRPAKRRDVLFVPADAKKRDDKDEEKTRLEDRADRAVEVEVELTPDDSDESSPKPPLPAADDQDSPGSTVLFKIEVSQDLGQGDRSQQRQEEPVVKEVARRAVARPASEEQLQRAGSKARGPGFAWRRRFTAS
jgi:hypothetical protein